MAGNLSTPRPLLFGNYRAKEFTMSGLWAWMVDDEDLAQLDFFHLLSVGEAENEFDLESQVEAEGADNDQEA
jgi:hypothetical protein